MLANWDSTETAALIIRLPPRGTFDPVGPLEPLKSDPATLQVNYNLIEVEYRNKGLDSPWWLRLSASRYYHGVRRPIWPGEEVP